MAKDRDEQLAQAKSKGETEKLGAFFGVPISIKDQICEEGETLTCGSTWLGSHYVAKTDAPIVEMMKREGAIPIVRGNLPQFVWVGHTENRIYGRAMNPRDPTRTCGGSSGGDGAIVASRCAMFGIGTDIGGSIRSPAACNGIIGFKPTAQRSSARGILVPAVGYSMD